MDEQYSPRDRELIEELRDRIERDYVSVGELSIWLAGVVLVMVGLHLVFGWLGRKEESSKVTKPVAKAQTRVWVGRFEENGFALVQVPTDSPAAADFIDERLAEVYGQEVVSYWLSVFRFLPPSAETAPEDLEWAELKATATIGGQPRAALALPDNVDHARRLQLAALSAPVRVRAGHETRVQLVFPRHDRGAMEKVQLDWKGGSITLEPAERAVKALQDFRRSPTREFFESAHADDGSGSGSGSARKPGKQPEKQPEKPKGQGSN